VIRAFTASDFSMANSRASHGFTPAQASVLERSASQSAIVLKKTRVHNDLEECQVGTLRLFDSKTIGILTWGLDDRITDANQVLLRTIGYDRDSLVSDGMSWTELTPPDWHNADEKSLMDLKQMGIALPYEKEFFRKDGTRVPVLVANLKFYRNSRQRLAFVIDLSDRKRAEEAARESERRYQEAKMELARVNRIAITEQLSASIVHEVSQPVAGAVTNAQVALRRLSAEPLNVDAVRQALNRMVRDGNRAADVIHRIRALINKAPPRREDLKINEAILEVVALTRGEVMKNGVSLRTQLAENLPSVQGDRVQLQQVMLNLIVNAVEAMSTSGDEPRNLRISTARVRSDALLITVQDSGPGVDSADIERLFDSFYSTKSAGLGMGLSICRAIVEGHGGKLWVSTCVPRGAIFQFTLPVCADGA
jgi:PAS domain S-box-containing protein